MIIAPTTKKATKSKVKELTSGKAANDVVARLYAMKADPTSSSRPTAFITILTTVLGETKSDKKDYFIGI